MEDKFEKFIRDNRVEVDHKTPPDSVWHNINSKLSQKKSVGYIRYWQAAAVIFFIVSVGLFIKNYQPMNTDKAISESLTEFKTTEEYYFNVIESQQGILTKYLENFPALADDFKNDLTELNQNYNKLKKDFETTGDTDVLNALIKNLQLQQELLNNQLKIIKQIEEENENVSI